MYVSVQFSSVTQSCPTLCDTMNCSTPGLPVHHQLPEFTQTHVHQVGDAIQASHPLLLLPPIPPSIRVFSNESTLCIRWPKYWSFSFSISPSNEHQHLASKKGYVNIRLKFVLELVLSDINNRIGSVPTETVNTRQPDEDRENNQSS